LDRVIKTDGGYRTNALFFIGDWLGKQYTCRDLREKVKGEQSVASLRGRLAMPA
jgi:hypothetical protein